MTARLIRLVTGDTLSECPKCGSPGLRRSQVRFYELLRKALTSSRPYRCYGCRLRVWGHLRPEPVPDADAAAWPLPGVSQSLDLTALDRLS